MSLLKGLPPQPPVLGTTEVDTQIAKGDKLVEEQRDMCIFSPNNILAPSGGIGGSQAS